MTTMTLNEAACEALFASPLQPSDALTTGTVADAIDSTVRRLGASGCASQMAQEFGDHPEIAADRMRWIRQLTSDLSECLLFPAVVTSSMAAAACLLSVPEAA